MLKVVTTEKPWSFGDITEMMAHRGENAGQLPVLLRQENGVWQYVDPYADKQVYTDLDFEEDGNPPSANLGRLLMVAAANIGMGSAALGVTNIISGWLAFAVFTVCATTFAVLNGAA